MASGDETIVTLTKQLINLITGFDDASEHMKTLEEFAFGHIFNSNYFFTKERKDIVQKINSLSEKFVFHGFVRQAEDLKMYTDKFFKTTHLVEDARVSIMELLLELSESPTTKFAENPNLLDRQFEESEEIVDWGAYLLDTKVVLRQTFSDTSSDWSETLSDISLNFGETSTRKDETDYQQASETIKFDLVDTHREKREAVEYLRTNVQNEWWNKENVVVLPPSTLDDAHVGIVWQKYVNYVTIGLIQSSVNILPEYRILREILWLFFVPHSCASFEYVNNNLLPKKNIGISSVRPETLQSFLMVFVPYFQYLHTFADFKKSLLGEYFITSIPDTYRSYNTAVEEIINPVFTRIKQIEDSVRKQEEIHTLLSVARELRPLFKSIELLHQIHTEVLKGSHVDTPCLNVTRLLSRLYYGLLNATSKQDQNLYLTLYLKSLYKYFTIIDIWLSQDVLEDLTDEFVIIDKNPKKNVEIRMENLPILNKRKNISEDWQMEYKLRKLDSLSNMDGMLNIICTKVLQLGKNTHLLRLLGKLHLVSDECGDFRETLHEEFVETVLREAINFIGTDPKVNLVTASQEIVVLRKPEPTSVICPEIKASLCDLDTVENIIDGSDGFLATVFEQYLSNNAPNVKVNEENLHERINQSIDKLFPVKQIMERSFIEILQKRYSVPGLMVKNILVNQYQLKKYISLIKHVYLFEDDIIFPFYRKIFAQFEAQQMWGNFFWLTSQIQDLLMDIYPEFYEGCRVDVAPNWRLCTNPIQACDMLSIHFKIDWPVNIIIRADHMSKYHEIFQFILKIKWALHTLNHLSFTVIEPRNIHFSKHTPLMQNRIRQLELMRFWLINDVCSMQHYVLGHLFTNSWKKFDKSIEESYDIETLLRAHDVFIRGIYNFCKQLRDYKSKDYGFSKILSLVSALQIMWHNIYDLDDFILKQCKVDYLKCHKFLKPIIEVDLLF